MIGKLLGRTALFGAACVAYGTFIESRDFRVRRANVPVLPSGSPRIRVLHISDSHLLVRNRARAAFLSSLSGLEPDLVIDTGDNVAEPEAIDTLADSLGRLLDVPGAFVMGSNDYSGPRFSNPLAYLLHPTTRDGAETERDLPTDRLRAALSSGGWVDLTQRRTSVTVNGLTLELRGTDDAHHGLDDYSEVAGKAAKDAAVSIGVTHAPYKRILDAMTADGVKLIFAGHTHGGQVCVPGYGALTTNCDLPARQAKGLSRHKAAGKSAWLHVSGGVGMSPTAPYRFACPPEVTLLTLTPRPVS